MSLESHLKELERKHQALKIEIAEAQTHPATENLHIRKLKKQKLRIKDEIRRSRSRAA